ncbi:MAG: outer membrane lipoprotein-sorting protein, partial [Planctomycetota bacterium]
MKNAMTLILMASFLLTVKISAAAPEVSLIMQKSASALNAAVMGTRKMEIIVKDGDKITSEWTARKVTKNFDDGKHALMVLLEPEELKGNAYLFWQPKDKPIMEWIYSPAVRRVRSLTAIIAYNPFMGTDFTWADFGIRDPGGEH